MLTIIQIIAILQGIFLGFTLFQRRQEYKAPVFWLFMGCIVSVILFSLGDDDYNLMVSDAKWFFFQEPLMVTFFFLFIRYKNSDRDKFDRFDTIFFLPYLLYVVVKTLTDISQFENSGAMRFGAEALEFSFAGMLLYSIYDVFRHRKEKWLLAFTIALAFIFIIDEASNWLFGSKEAVLFLDSYVFFLIAVFLFYFVTYKLITAPKDVLPSIDNKYKSSTLTRADVDSTISALNRLMTEKQLFKNQKLNANEVAAQLGITRQHLSEVLNVHLGMRFQDFLNQYRVEEFIKCLHEEKYENYTLLGIATEVGFSSKSSFNATFKKIKGVTPSQYKKGEM